MTLPAIHNGG